MFGRKKKPRVLVWGCPGTGRKSFVQACSKQYECKLDLSLEDTKYVHKAAGKLDFIIAQYRKNDVSGVRKLCWEIPTLVYMLDLSGNSNLWDSLDELSALLTAVWSDSKSVNTLVLANKADLLPTITIPKLHTLLSDIFRQRPRNVTVQWELVPCSAAVGRGLRQAVEWIDRCVRKKRLPNVEILEDGDIVPAKDRHHVFVRGSLSARFPPALIGPKIADLVCGFVGTHELYEWQTRDEVIRNRSAKIQERTIEHRRRDFVRVLKDITQYTDSQFLSLFHKAELPHWNHLDLVRLIWIHLKGFNLSNEADHQKAGEIMTTVFTDMQAFAKKWERRNDAVKGDEKEMNRANGHAHTPPSPSPLPLATAADNNSKATRETGEEDRKENNNKASLQAAPPSSSASAFSVGTAGGDVFHVTTIFFWIQMVFVSRAKESTKGVMAAAPTFRDFLLRHSFLVNPLLILTYYSIPALSHNTKAATELVLPDMKPFPSAILTRGNSNWDRQ